ncbi:hypothetical protein ACFW89_34615, partial [Streptomyces albidoflavus]
MDEEEVATPGPGSPMDADPAGRRQFVDDAARRFGGEGLAGASAGVMAQEVCEDPLGQRDAAHDRVGDDGVR